MRYSPTPSNRKAFVTMLTLIIVAAALFFLSTLNIGGGSILQLCALLSASGGVYIFLRYRTVYYTYVICPKEQSKHSDNAVTNGDVPVNLNFIAGLDFVVIRHSGVKSDWTECRVGVGELVECFDYFPSDQLSSSHISEIRRRGISSFYYTVTLKGDRYLACVFRSRDYGEILVVIEPDAAMRDFLISAANKNRGV